MVNSRYLDPLPVQQEMPLQSRRGIILQRFISLMNIRVPIDLKVQTLQISQCTVMCPLKTFGVWRRLKIYVLRPKR